MSLATVDWVIIVAYLVLAIGIGLWFSRRAGQSMEDYFLAGRSLPWWLAGTSVVATTFAADTPLAVSGLVRTGGIYENWFWWAGLMSALLSVFFYARLWRRLGVVTDLEFTEVRYDGKPAAVLRGLMSVYIGVLVNCVTMGWVMLAMAKIATAALGWPESLDFSLGGADYEVSGKVVLLAVLVLVAVSYTVLSGLWGVVATDIFQFFAAMVGSIALAAVVIYQLGGPTEMVKAVAESPGVNPRVFSFIPDFETAGGLAVFTFVVYISVQWWAGTPYGSYSNQRILSTKNERHATLAVVWGTFANFVLRTWPWVIVGVASLAVFPLTKGEDPELAYPKMMVHFLPTGLKGLMVVAFIAAFMSTIDTHLNWGSSYLVNDLYRRFVRRDASPRHYVTVSRLVTLGLMGVAAVFAWQMESIAGGWKYVAKLTAGIGLVVLLRWYWWRISAWSEIAALGASAVMANVLPFIPGLDGKGMFAVHLVILVPTATVVWVVVTFLTRPTSMDKLEAFYRRVRPGGWWGPVAARCPDVAVERVRGRWWGWLAGVVSVYSAMFGVGYLCLGRYAEGAAALVVAAASGWLMLRRL